MAAARTSSCDLFTELYIQLLFMVKLRVILLAQVYIYYQLWVAMKPCFTDWRYGRHMVYAKSLLIDDHFEEEFNRVQMKLRIL